MISFGIDSLIQQDPEWKLLRIGLVTNHAATTNTLQPSRKALLEKGFNIVKLFSPEHGLDITGEDGMKMHDGIDPLTLLPVISLYGDKLQPGKNDLLDIDVIVFDIPDIGCRFYTYLWTLAHILEASAMHQKKLIILDRPNPISGFMDLTEGPMLNEADCSSFIGRWSIPIRHSCTFGELAMYFNRSKSIHASIEIIKCDNWHREMFQPDWEIDFVQTSPAMNSFDAAMFYPGLGLLEATNISEGRGTPWPFTIAGSPWINGDQLAAIINQLNLDAVQAEPIHFKPTESKYGEEDCHGVRLMITDTLSYRPVFTGLLLIRLIKDLYPFFFEWKPYPTQVNPSGKYHLDKLTGIQESEKIFELPFDKFLQKIQQMTTVREWRKQMQPYLLY
jgi:uncharacterized protein YbbC (DUF1343 family)